MRTIPIHYKSFIIISPFEEKRNTIFLYMPLNPPMRKNNRKEAVSRTQRHDKQPPESGKRPRCFAHKTPCVACLQLFCRFLFKGKRGFHRETPLRKGRHGHFCTHPVRVLELSTPQRRRNIIGALPLDIFARKRGERSFSPSI